MAISSINLERNRLQRRGRLMAAFGLVTGSVVAAGAYVVATQPTPPDWQTYPIIGMYGLQSLVMLTDALASYWQRFKLQPKLIELSY